MAISLVQSVNTIGSTNPQPITISATGAGNLIVVLFLDEPETNTISSITDNASGGSNTYIQVSGAYVSTANGNIFTDIWYAKNSHFGATSLSIIYNGAHNGVIQVVEYSGVDITSPIDTSGNTSGIGISAVGPSLTIINSGDVLLSVVAKQTTNPTGVSSPWSVIPSAFMGNFVQLINPGSTGSFQANYTPLSTDGFCSSGVAFVPAIVPLTLLLSDTQTSSDFRVSNVEKPLVDTQTSSDSITFARGLNLLDSATSSDSGSQAFSIESSFIASQSVPIVEILTNELLPASTKAYYIIEE